LYRTTSQYDAASDSLERVTHLNITSASAASDQADAAYQNARAFIGIAMVIAALLVIAALFYVRRFVSTPLLDLAGDPIVNSACSRMWKAWATTRNAADLGNGTMIAYNIFDLRRGGWDAIGPADNPDRSRGTGAAEPR
jgi:hypothetical protein